MAPRTWTELIETAGTLCRPPANGQPRAFYGFLFPGRDSGCSARSTNYCIGAGGDLFDRGPAARVRSAGRPVGTSSRSSSCITTGGSRHVTSPNWHYDEISASFRAGDAAMVSDWPGSYHLYRDRCHVCRGRSRRARAVAGGPGAAGAPRTPAAIRSPFRARHDNPRPLRRSCAT